MIHVTDFAQIYSTSLLNYYEPNSVNELQQIVSDNYYSNQRPICIQGATYSHGGQTMVYAGIGLNLNKLNVMKLYSDQTVWVQAGATWYQLLSYLDQYNLSVAEMQSYANFSVGGSISVNCHGRGMKYGSLVDTILSLEVMLANGQIIIIGPEHELFRAIVGGFGGIAIIISVKLKTEVNYKIERAIIRTNSSELYPFLSKLIQDKDVIFYNGNVYPTDEGNITHVIWLRSQKELTDHTRLKSHQDFYPSHMLGEQLIRRSVVCKWLRSQIEPNVLCHEKVVWRNNEMSYDVNELKPLFHYPTTSILQEYFIPLKTAQIFYNYLIKIIYDYQINIINLSIRWVKSTTIPLLNYAPTDSVAFVLYLNILNGESGVNYAKIWTQLLIDISHKLAGSYYLPYLPLATKEQFRQCYPNWNKWMDIKKSYDPKNILRNFFIQTYLS